MFCLGVGWDIMQWPYCPLPESIQLFLTNANSVDTAATTRQRRSLWVGIFLYLTLPTPNSAQSEAPHTQLGMNAALYYCSRQI